MSITLTPEQTDAVSRLKNGSVLQGGVGSGKTYTSLQYYIENHSDRDLLVITTAKVRDSFDWMKSAQKMNVPVDRITVDSWNNIAAYENLKHAFIVFDEQRLVGTGAWVKTFWRMARENAWILLSATPGDTWLDYAPVFIANGLYRNISEFRNEHVIYSRFSSFPKVERYVNEGRLLRHKRDILVPMEIKRHTKRHVEVVKVPHDEELFSQVWKKRWHVYEDRPIKDAGEMFRVGRKVVSQDARRLVELRKIMEKHPKLIVFYNFNYELDILRTLGEDRPLAEWNGKQHDAVPLTNQWIYLVQYNAGSEGWNCITTDTVVFWSLTYSYKQYEQAMGRIDRMNTPFVDLYYKVLMSDSMTCKAVWKALQRKKNFNMSSASRKFNKETEKKVLVSTYK